MSLFHQMQMVPIQQMTPSEKWEALVMHLQVQQHREMQVATLQMMGIPSARDRLPTLTEEQNACSHNEYHEEGNASYPGWQCKLCGARLCYMPTRNTLQNLQMRQKEQLQSATSAAMPSTREIQLMNARVQANQDLSDRLEAETAIGMASVSAAIQDLARVLENLGVQQRTSTQSLMVSMQQMASSSSTSNAMGQAPTPRMMGATTSVKRNTPEEEITSWTKMCSYSTLPKKIQTGLEEQFCVLWWADACRWVLQICCCSRQYPFPMCVSADSKAGRRLVNYACAHGDANTFDIVWMHLHHLCTAWNFAKQININIHT